MTEVEAKIASWVLLGMVCFSNHWAVTLALVGLFVMAAKKGYGGL